MNPPVHRFLQFVPAELSAADAKHIVSKAIDLLSFAKKPRLDWQKTLITVPVGEGRTQVLKLREILEETRKFGYPRSVYEVTDRSDGFFGGRFLMATDSTAINLTIRVGNFQRELSGPCRSAPLENELTDDILHFREGACETSVSPNFYDCTRHYRSFLQSSVSLVDCFLNRYIELHSLQSPSIKLSFANRGPLEDRLDSWANEFAPSKLAAFKESAERARFTLLRKARNNFVHAAEPYVGVSIKDLPQYLNAVRGGVGGLLLKMRELAGQPTLGFIEKLRAAPLVEYRPKPSTDPA